MTTGTPLRFVERPMRFWSVGWDVDSGVTEADREATLLARIARRDATAFETLYDRYSRAVYSLAVRMLGNPQAAQEVAQEIFLHIWRGAGEFIPTRGSARSWVLSLAHHRTVDALRRQRVRTVEPLAEGGPGTGGGADVVEQALRGVEGATVRNALMTLSPEQREAIVLAYYGGYTQQEIANRLRIPLGTVKTRIRDGMQRLRVQLVQGEEERE
jgi:RNA polymerase sigma-70 factor, ECF subfamily